MEDLDNFEIKEKIEFCKDISSAIWEQKRGDLTFKYNELVQIGQIAYFLQSLMREKHKNIIGMDIVRRLATLYGINQFDVIFSYYKTINDQPKIYINEEGNLVVNLSTYDEVIEYCKNIWDFKEKHGLLRDKNQNYLIKILGYAITPKKFEDFKKIITDINSLKKIIDDCLELGLLINDSDYYFTPKLFKKINKETLDIMSDFDMASNQIIQEFEKIKRNPAYPIDNLDKRIRKAIIEGAFKGILVPIPVIIPNEDPKYFVFVNPKDLENGDLSYETAAYFRFNEVYADKLYGRLEMPLIFLDKLINQGIAGNATNIGLNYFPLEVKGVIKVVEGRTSNLKRMVTLKQNVLKEAKELLKQDFGSGIASFQNQPSWLSDPAGFRAIFSNSEFIKRNIIDLKKLLRDM